MSEPSLLGEVQDEVLVSLRSQDPVLCVFLRKDTFWNTYCVNTEVTADSAGAHRNATRHLGPARAAVLNREATGERTSARIVTLRT